MGLPTWLLIFPVLGFLVFVHELAHFATAKWFGIKVTEFGFGFPPRIFGVRYKETLYSVNWLPIGGFVRMVGEEDPTDPRSFARQSVAKRAVVLVAGSAMNLLVPVVIFSVLLMLPHDRFVGGDVLVSAVIPGSPADAAGLRSGDTILSINGERVALPSELIDITKASLGQPTELTVRRGSVVGGLGSSPEFAAVDTVTVVPRVDPPRLRVVDEITNPSAPPGGDAADRGVSLNPDGTFSFEPSGDSGVADGEISLSAARRYDPTLQVGDTLRQGAIGVTIGLANPKIEQVTEPIWLAVPMSFTTIWDIMVFTKNGLVDGLSSGSNPGVAGPIGIAQATGEVVDELGFAWIFQLTALLSISLGILNILPIPALDGGRLVFVLLEWVRRGKRISPQKEGLVHLAGFAVLIGFVLFISYFDIVRLLNGESLIR